MDRKEKYVFVQCNTIEDCNVITLPVPLELKSDWTVALCEMKYMLKKKYKHTDVIVMCDMVTESPVGNILLPILRKISIGGQDLEVTAANMIVSHTFDRLYHMPVTKDFISEIKLYLKHEDDLKSTFNIKYLSCTLVFQEKSYISA